MKNNELKTQGERLKFLIKALSTNYKQFARKSDLSDTYIYKLRDDKIPVTLPALYKISIGWPSLNPEFLFNGTGDPTMEGLKPRFREALKYLLIDTTRAKKLFGPTIINDVLFGDITTPHIKKVCEIDEDINFDYISTGKGKLISSSEDKYIEKIADLEKQIKLLTRINNLLEDEINRLKD